MFTGVEKMDALDKIRSTSFSTSLSGNADLNKKLRDAIHLKIYYPSLFSRGVPKMQKNALC